MGGHLDLERKGLDDILVEEVKQCIKEVLRLNLKPWQNLLRRIKGEVRARYEPMVTALQSWKGIKETQISRKGRCLIMIV